MCGFIGIIDQGLNQERNFNIAKKMSASLHHRGPDESGIINSKHFVFAHQRLSIIDPNNGKQPMYSSDGRFILLFNGEIYNYIELRKQLESHYINFKNQYRH